MKTNYNSVDLSEVEFADEEREPRDPSPDILEVRRVYKLYGLDGGCGFADRLSQPFRTLLQLREAMVNHSRAHMQIRLKFHFDEMVREGAELGPSNH